MAQGIAEHGGLFGDFLGHEMFVPALVDGAAEVFQGITGDKEAVLAWPSQSFFRQFDLIFTERAAMRRARALLVGAAITYDGAYGNQAGLCLHGLRRFDSLADRADVVAIGNADDLPAHGLIALRDVFGEGHGCFAVQCDLIVVIKENQLAQPPVTGERRCLDADAFHEVAIADQRIGAVIDHGIAAAIEIMRQIGFGQRQPDCRCRALSAWAGGGFDADCVAIFRMSGGAAAPLAEVFEVIQRDIETGQMQQGIQQHGSVSGAKDKAVTIGPLGIFGVKAQVVHPQRISHWRRAHRQARMPAVGFLHRIHRQGADGIDSKIR